VHQEDFAQVLNVRPSEKYGHANYETLVRITDALCPPEDVDELLRRLVFMVLCGNGDAHLKNFSLTYPDGRAARLAPAYDLLCTRAYIPDDRLALNLGGERRFASIGAAHFASLARRTGVTVHGPLGDVRSPRG
jgi:serine/threonine-protein kinase HipA